MVRHEPRFTNHEPRPHPMTDADYMKLALDACRRGVEAGQSPFGACIVHEGKVLAASHNKVWLTTDPSAHGEVQTIREACKAAGTIFLAGATIYSTTEPCPMCFSAIHWSRITRIYYGTSIADVQALGFNELTISNKQMKQLGNSRVEINPGFMREECLGLLDSWRQLSNRT